MKTVLIGAATALALSATPAAADTLTFESPNVTNLPGQTRVNSDQEGNYKVTRQSGTIRLGSDPTFGNDLFFPVVTNGSPVAIFSLTTLDGSLFTLGSFDTKGIGRFAISAIRPQTATQGPSAYAYNANVTSPGFTTFTNANNGSDYRGVAVSEVDFTVYTFAAGSTGLNFDNVVVNPYVPAVTGVPELDTWAMMIAGFGAIGTAARRRARPTTALRAA